MPRSVKCYLPKQEVTQKLTNIECGAECVELISCEVVVTDKA